ncbi:amidohydrolase [Actinomadura sp. B10D3]|uniref:amidohydrolase n=1 Tax=Actinomadura sp. B10D3 TaxID=3153557 RepID=UPI00325D8BF3
MSEIGGTGEVAPDHEELIAIRRYLHANPELGYQEFGTTERLRARLTAAGLEPKLLPAGIGLFCDIGPDRGPIIALRADIDALPMQDEKNVPYRSKVPGVAHACGHDVHTVMVLGAGLALARQAKDLPGRVRLLFQPAEEIPGGAWDIIRAGGIEGVERIFALHCDPSLEVGQVGLVTGPITASIDVVEVTVTGPGGHTARPHLTVNLVPAVAAMVNQLRAALPRGIDARSSFNLEWGMVEAGSAANVIPKEGYLKGTLRCHDNEVRGKALEILKEQVPQVAEKYGAEAELTIERGLPPTVNDATCIQTVRDATGQVLGPDAAVSTEQSMGGDDFGLYLNPIKGAYVRLGVRTPGAAKYDLHQGGFDVDEACIEVGVSLLQAIALNALAQ